MYKLTNFKLNDIKYKLQLISIMRYYFNCNLIEAKSNVNEMLTADYELITNSSDLISKLEHLPNFTFNYEEMEDKHNHILTKDTLKSDAMKWFDNLSDIEKDYVKEYAYSLFPRAG